MLRHLVNFLALLSVLLCAAFAVLWVRSYWTSDVVMHTALHDDGLGGIRIRGGTDWGVVYLSRYDVRYVNLRPTMPLSEYLISMHIMLFRDHRPWNRRIARAPDVPPFRHVFGFGYQDQPTSKLGIHGMSSQVSVRQRTVTFPLWAGVLVFGAPPLLVMLRRERRRWRAAREFCVSCGYDLRATPGRCPECGTAVGASVS